MALIKPSTPFDIIKRKFAKSDEIHFRNRKADNATISVRMKHPYDGGNSANQIAQRAKFKAASDAVGALTQEQIAAYETAFKKQHKYITLRGYMIAQEFAKLTPAQGGEGGEG